MCHSACTTSLLKSCNSTAWDKMNVSMELEGWIKIIKIMSCNKFRSTFFISSVTNHVFLADNLTIWFYIWNKNYY